MKNKNFFVGAGIVGIICLLAFVVLVFTVNAKEKREQYTVLPFDKEVGARYYYNNSISEVELKAELYQKANKILAKIEELKDLSITDIRYYVVSFNPYIITSMIVKDNYVYYLAFDINTLEYVLDVDGDGNDLTGAERVE